MPGFRTSTIELLSTHSLLGHLLEVKGGEYLRCPIPYEAGFELALLQLDKEVVPLQHRACNVLYKLGWLGWAGIAAMGWDGWNGWDGRDGWMAGMAGMAEMGWNDWDCWGWLGWLVWPGWLGWLGWAGMAGMSRTPRNAMGHGTSWNAVGHGP